MFLYFNRSLVRLLELWLGYYLPPPRPEGFFAPLNPQKHLKVYTLGSDLLPTLKGEVCRLFCQNFYTSIRIYI